MAARHPSLMAEDELAELLAEQVTYYRARAEEYDATYPLDDGADVEARARLVAALEALAPPGRVLELALRHRAVDGGARPPRMRLDRR
jgi:hypothetical protein